MDLIIGISMTAAAAAIAMVLIHRKAVAANMRMENEVRIKEKELQLVRTELDKLSVEQKEATAQIIALQRRNAALEAEKKSDEEKEKADSIRQQLMNAEFERLAGSILEHNRRVFLDTNRNELDKVLSPLKEKLSEFGETVRNTYNADTRERFSLQQQIEKLVTANKQISDDARRLAQALKGNTKIQGDWGEHILETMLEHSGLTKGREYDTQETLRDKTGKPLTSESEKKMRPDVIVYYPDDTKIIIDSKTSLTAYLRYTEAENEDEKTAAAKEHVLSVRKHVSELAGKSYQDYVKSVDFVMMFIPNDYAYMLAMEQDSRLWMDAYDKRVMIVSPMHLISVLKMVSALWKKEEQNINTMKIVKTASDIYAKLCAFCESMEKVGKSIENAENNYEEAMKRLSTGKDNAIRKLELLRNLGIDYRNKHIPERLLHGNEYIDTKELTDNTDAAPTRQTD